MNLKEAIRLRKEIFINHYAHVDKAAHAKSAFWLSAVKCFKYEETGLMTYLDEAKDMFWYALSHTVSAFGLTGGLYHYHAYGHLYDTEMLEAFKAHYTTTDIYDKERYTANHLLMSVTDRFLAEELYPTEVVCHIFEDDHTCKKTILRLLDEYVHEGDPEWNSGSYFAVHYACLRLLAMYAQDEEVQKKAMLASEWMLIKGAMTWLDGHVAMSKEREYKAFRGQNTGNGGSILLWLYFGGAEPVDHEGWFNVHALLGDYEPPSEIYEILKEKAQTTYTHKEMHYYHLKDRIHFYDPKLVNEGRQDVENYVYLTSRMHPTYGLYSSIERVSPRHEYIEFMDRFYIQMHRWGLCFTGKEGSSVLYLEHPSGVKKEEVGATAWERVLQHEDTIIGIYHIPEDREDRYLEAFLPKDKRTYEAEALVSHLMVHNKYILGHIPTNYDDCINDCDQGRLYLDYGDVKVAVCMTGPFLWQEKTPIFKRQTGDLGFVIEVSEDYESLEAFKIAVDQQMAKLTFDEANLTLRYESIAGYTMTTQFIEDGRRKDFIDGNQLDYTQWDLIDNPWMHQSYRGNQLSVSVNKQALVYDFDQWVRRRD